VAATDRKTEFNKQDRKDMILENDKCCKQKVSSKQT